MKHVEFSKDPSTKVKRKIGRNVGTFHQLDFLLQPALYFLGTGYIHIHRMSLWQVWCFSKSSAEDLVEGAISSYRSVVTALVLKHPVLFQSFIYSCLHAAVHPRRVLSQRSVRAKEKNTNLPHPLEEEIQRVEKEKQWWSDNCPLSIHIYWIIHLSKFHVKIVNACAVSFSEWQSSMVLFPVEI